MTARGARASLLSHNPSLTTAFERPSQLGFQRWTSYLQTPLPETRSIAVRRERTLRQAVGFCVENPTGARKKTPLESGAEFATHGLPVRRQTHNETSSREVGFCVEKPTSGEMQDRMTQVEKFPDFEAYLQDLLRRSRRSLSEIENKRRRRRSTGVASW
jgi:hypothetical protein